MRRDKIACNCRNITYGQIADAVRNGARTADEVMAATGAGMSCGKCREFLKYLVRDILEEQESS